MLQEETDLEASKSNDVKQNYWISKKLKYARKCKQLKRNISLITTGRCWCLEDRDADALLVKAIFPPSAWIPIFSNTLSFNANVTLRIFFLRIKNTLKVFFSQESQENYSWGRNVLHLKITDKGRYYPSINYYITCHKAQNPNCISKLIKLLWAINFKVIAANNYRKSKFYNTTDITTRTSEMPQRN